MKEFKALSHHRRLQTELKRARDKYEATLLELQNTLKAALINAIAADDGPGAAQARKAAERRRAALVELETECACLEKALPIAKAKAQEDARAEFSAAIEALRKQADAILPTAQAAAQVICESSAALDGLWREYKQWRQAWAASFGGLPGKATPGDMQDAQALASAAASLRRMTQKTKESAA